jgi:hypothetical protein
LAFSNQNQMPIEKMRKCMSIVTYESSIIELKCRNNAISHINFVRAGGID